MRKIITILMCTVFAFTGVTQVHAEEILTTDQTEETQQLIDSDESEDDGSLDSSEAIEEPEEDTAEQTEEAAEEPEEEAEPAETEETVEEAEPEEEEVTETVEITAPLLNEEKADVEPDVSFTYSAHVQNVGWMNNVKNGQTAGVTGRALRMEALKITPSAALSKLGTVMGQAHVQNYGWMSPVSAGNVIGTSGAALRVEAVRFWLTGTLAEQYDIYYRVHIQNNGWLGWAKNGADAGSTGLSLRMEAIEIKLVKKGMLMNAGSLAASVTGNGLTYQAHVQNIGWANATSAPNTAGTTGRSLRMESIKVTLPEELKALGNVSVETHVQNKGWLKGVGSGQVAGSTGEGLRLEALKIRLTGDLAKMYDIWYCAHVADYGWLGWTSNGGIAGSVGLGRSIEAVAIDLVPKGMTAYTPSASYVERATATASNIVSTARSWVGVGVYGYGGEDPHTGADCAGFVRYVYRQNGIELARSSWEMVNNGYQVSSADVRAGDLAIWSNHVAIMTSNSTCVHALNPYLGIMEHRMGAFTASGYFMGYYRINGVN